MMAKRATRRHGLGFRLLLWFLPRLLDGYLRFVDWTSRKTIIDEHYDTSGTRNETCIFASVHQGLLYFIQHYRDRDGIVMASRSQDGDLVVAILRRFGWQPVRGSSSFGGIKALTEMIAPIRDGVASGGLVCDAPRGPYGDPKIGIVLLAKETGRPITPCAIWMTRKLLGRNWDRTLIPLPFSRIFFKFGEPISVPADARSDECERLRRRLGDRIMALVFDVQEASGEPRQDFRPEAAQRTAGLA